MSLDDVRMALRTLGQLFTSYHAPDEVTALLEQLDEQKRTARMVVDHREGIDRALQTLSEGKGET